jgi:hypothetical protein
MRKEVIIAVFAGIVFGAVIAFGVWRANIAFNPQGSVSDTTDNISEKANSNGVDLAISEPVDKSVYTESGVDVKGLTKPKNIVIISTEDEDYILKAQEDGSFDQSIELVSGINQVEIASINETGARSSSQLVLIYSSEFEISE